MRESGARLLGRFQDIARSPNGVDQFERERIVDLAAQSSDIDVHNIGVAVKVHVPDCFGDLGSRQHFARAPRQQGQKKELFGSQVQALTGAGSTLAQYIDFKVGQAKGLLRTRRSAAQQRSHPGKQFGKGERLYQIVVRPQLESSYPLVYSVASGQKKHERAPAFLAQASENLPTIEAREHHVENDEIELQFLRKVQPVQSISG